MQKKKIFLVCALLIFAGLVFSPITASALETYGSCRTSKWGVTTRVEMLVNYNRVPGRLNRVSNWKIRARSWGKGAGIADYGNAVLEYWHFRRAVALNNRWHNVYKSFVFRKGRNLRAGFSIWMWQGRQYSKQRCNFQMKTLP